MALYQQVLLFPDRAENLGRFSAYKVRFEHWHPLSEEFKACFREVYERGNSAILLIHGEQGSGKTLFARRIQDDFERCKRGEVGTTRDNLWHALVGDPHEASVVKSATAESTVKTIKARNGWFKELQSGYARPEHRVRVFIADDAHRSDFLRAWAGLDQVDFLKVGAKDALPAVAERMVELCRTEFQQALFVLFSARSELMVALHEEIEKTHRGLSHSIELPLPDSETKEEIVRQNTNSLNPYSYWYCLDGAGPNGKTALHTVLSKKAGFTETFRAVDDALKRTVSQSRRGRPANQNLLTLCTLGSPLAEVEAFVASHDLPIEAEFCGDHFGMWSGARVSWASALVVGEDAALARRAQLLESEFAFRWVALGPKATYLLLESQHFAELRAEFDDVLHFAPSIAKPEATSKIATLAQMLEDKLGTLDIGALEVDEFMANMKRLGQRRSTAYEPILAEYYTGYDNGLSVYPRLRPDLTVGQYVPCAIASTNGDNTEITRAISRKGHTIEFTSFLRDGMEGLSVYLRKKVDVYAQMLESV